jgi:glycosyltransferase involved in cell wall biosynthesis
MWVRRRRLCRRASAPGGKRGRRNDILKFNGLQSVYTSSDSLPRALQHSAAPGRCRVAGGKFPGCVGLIFVHIAFWSPAWPLEKYQNGIITYVHWMRRGLERRGHRVSVFTGEVDRSSTDERVYNVRPGRAQRLWRRLRRRSTPVGQFEFAQVIADCVSSVHRRDPIDILEMEESFGWCGTVAARSGLPLLVKLHGPAFLTMSEEERATPFGQEKIEREGLALRTARAVIAPSQFTLARTLERYRLEPRERGCIVNPLVMAEDTPLWSLDRCDRDSILFVGRFDSVKGADLVLSAFRSALKSRPSLKLVFVGPDVGLSAAGGPKLQFDAYRDSIFEPSLRSRVEYRGRMANRDISKLRVQAMMTVIASRMESQCYALLEAMLQGCPVVSTDAGGLPESVVNGVTGRLARSGDAEALAAQMLAMGADPEAAAGMGRAARRYVLDRHAPAQVATASLALYERVIAAQ